MSSETGLLQVELLQGQQSLKLLVHVKHAGDKGSTVSVAKRSGIEVCHALMVACYCLKQKKSWTVLSSNSYQKEKSRKVVPLTCY